MATSTGPQSGPGVDAAGRAQISARTLRQDRWWQYPLTTGAILLFFIAYATVRIFMRDYYWAAEEHYLTPLYSPCISESCVPGSSHFGTPLPEMPIFIPIGILTFVILAGLPRHLLLLPQGGLPVAVPVPRRVRGAGAAQVLLR